MEEKIGGYIKKIIFNNDKSIDLKENDIIVFTGPNNVGKSQSLKDLYSLSEKNISTKVIKDIEIIKHDFDIEKFFKKYSKIEDKGNYTMYSFMGNRITDSDVRYSLNKIKCFEYLRNFFVANLVTDNRLSISNPAGRVDRDKEYTHPIQYAAFDSNKKEWLSNNFKKAFGKDITANYLHGNSIPLCIGKKINKEDIQLDEIDKIIDEYSNILEKYDKVNEQGDGIRSFTGILLYLMMKNYSIYLIDEPESFLHAPQANIMGKIIGENTENKQIFISTHSEEIIKGLLTTCSKRVKIVRITRTENTNNFSILNNEDIEKVWKDPILKHSNILSSLFHKKVVLCESDSDCKMYSIIEDNLCSEKERYSEILYIHCGGKHRIAKVAKALKALNIDVRIIADIDVLNDENIFKGIIESFDINWNVLKHNYNILISNLHSSKEKIKKEDFKNIYEGIMKNNSKREFNQDEITSLQQALKGESPWHNIKKNGISAFSAGDQTNAFNNINEILKENKIFLVPVGEIENFVKTVGTHGPDWVNSVLEKYPDLNDNVYKKIKEFMKMVIE